MIYTILLAHWIADFICQTDDMAKNKSKSWKWLSAHIFTYFVVLFWICVIAIDDTKLVLQFALINSAGHFIIDMITSRVTSYLWSKERVHDFFVVIGFDQLLHVTILIFTAEKLGII
jgi:hypothetical protein